MTAIRLPQHPRSVRDPAPPESAHPLILADQAGNRSPRPPVRSLYIHTPFCVHKCHYCDFYSFVDTRDQQAAFVDRLIRELRALAPAARDAAGLRVPLHTIFVGGGTPSLLRVKLWERLLAALHDFYDLSLMRGGPGEFTVECNPESASPELLRTLAAGGVNRVSVGAQSFDPRHLKTLERWHDPANVRRAIDNARAAGIARQSVDLIFAIPGQTIDDWRRDLDTAVALGTTHLSCYNLTYEPNTAMHARLARGDFAPVDEDTEEAMFRLTLARLRDAGLDRYEVSNFAAPGAESEHNLAYWRQEQWLAAGPSASGHLWNGHDRRAGSWRWKNIPRLGDYLASASEHPDHAALAPVADVEAPDPARFIRERIMMGLRLREGLDAGSLLADLEAVSPSSVAPLLAEHERAHKAGWFHEEPAHPPTRGSLAATDRWCLSDEGFLICDFIAGQLMATIEAPPNNGLCASAPS